MVTILPPADPGRALGRVQGRNSMLPRISETRLQVPLRNQLAGRNQVCVHLGHCSNTRAVTQGSEPTAAGVLGGEEQY